MTGMGSVPINGIDAAKARLRGKWIRDAFLACGWVLSADTGQTDWDNYDTVANAFKTDGQTYGWNIFAMNDDLQATAPVFAKVYTRARYSTANGNYGCRIDIRLGHATDGAGNVIGNGYIVNYGGTTGDNGLDVASPICYYSGDPGRMSLIMWPALGGFTAYNPDHRGLILHHIERSVDATGKPTGEYVTMFSLGYGWNGNTNYKQLQSMVPADDTVGPRIVDSTSAPFVPMSAAYMSGGKCMASPLFPHVGRLGNPLTGILLLPASVGGGGNLQAEMYGKARTYRQFYVSESQGVFPLTDAPNTGQRLYVRWE